MRANLGEFCTKMSRICPIIRARFHRNTQKFALIMIKKCPLNDPDIYKRFSGQFGRQIYGGGTPLGYPWPSAMSCRDLMVAHRWNFWCFPQQKFLISQKNYFQFIKFILQKIFFLKNKFVVSWKLFFCLDQKSFAWRFNFHS